MPALWAAGIAAGGSILGGAIQGELGAQGAQSTNATMIDLANTQYTRRVADLKNAGLNPLLAVSAGGAATPQLMNPGMLAGQGIGQGIQQGAQSGIQAYTQATNAANIAEQTRGIQLDNIRKENSNPALMGMIDHDVAENGAQNVARQGGVLDGQMRLLATQFEMQQINVKQGALDYSQAVKMMPIAQQLAQTQLQLEKAGIPAAQAQAQMYQGPMGKYMPYIDKALGVLGVAGGVIGLGKVLTGGLARGPVAGPTNASPAPFSSVPIPTQPQLTGPRQ